MIPNNWNGNNPQNITREPYDHVDHRTFTLPPGQMVTAEDMLYYETMWINQQRNETTQKQIASAPKTPHEILLAHRAIREAIRYERELTATPSRQEFISTIVINENANNEDSLRNYPHRFVFNEQTSHQLQQNISNPHLRRRLGIYHTSMQEMSFYAHQEQYDHNFAQRQKPKKGKFKISIKFRKRGKSKMKDLAKSAKPNHIFKRKNHKKLSKKRIKKMRSETNKTSDTNRKKNGVRKCLRMNRIKFVCKLSALEKRSENLFRKSKLTCKSLCDVIWFFLGVVLFVLGLFTGAPVNYIAMTCGGILMAVGLVMMALRITRCINSAQNQREINQEKKKWTFLDKGGKDISIIS